MRIYPTLNTALDEIRLLSILPEVDSQPQLRCRMETVSLQDFTHQYRSFLANGLGETASRDILARWVNTNFHDPDHLVDRHHCPQVPKPDLYRYSWGDFATLSYTWGTSTQTEIIILNDNPLQIGTNLSHALHAFRKLAYFGHKYMLWVDAICINQNDPKERESQVAKMRNLYAGSWTTMTFLGEAAEGSGKAIDLIKTLSRIKNEGKAWDLRDKLQVEPGYLGDGKWLAFQRFILRPYWSRLWVVQEMALAPLNMLMFAGDDSVTWAEVHTALWAIHASLWYVKERCLAYDRKLLQVLKAECQPLEMEENLGRWEAEPLHHITKGLGRIAEKQVNNEGYLSIDEMLEVSNATLSRYALDKVYGLLAIMEPEIARRIVVDYSISESELFTKVSRLYIAFNGNLELLRSASCWNDTKTPSWAVDFFRKIRYRDKLTPELRYHADEGIISKFSFSSDGRFLTAKAVIIDSIDAMGGLARSEYEGYSVSRYMQSTKLEKSHISLASARLALHHALVGDRDGHSARSYAPSDGNGMPLFNLPASYEEAMAIFRERQWAEFALQGDRYNDWSDWRRSNARLKLGPELGYLGDLFGDEIPADAPLEPLWDAYLRFRHMASGRKFVTTVAGRFGFVAENHQIDNDTSTTTTSAGNNVQRGDLFCIVIGCSVPLVLRPCEGKFLILGESFIQGYMDGQMRTGIEEGKFSIQELVFC